MSSITVSRKLLERKVRRKLSDEVIADRVAMMGTDIESVNEKDMVVEIFPNRPDMLSEHGLARAFASFMGAEKGLRTYKVKDSKEKVVVDRSLAKIRPFTACAIVKNLSLDDEKIRDIIQLQEKMHATFGRNRKRMAIGVYPLEKISMPIYFTAKAPKDIVFRPLDAAKEMNASQILKDHSAGRAYGHLLEGFDKFPVFHDSAQRVLSMPPVINSHDAGRVASSTKELFVEVSGSDEWTLGKALNIMVSALADMGGDIYSMQVVYSNRNVMTPNLEPEVMKCDVAYVNRRLGLDLKPQECKRLLEKMGYAAVVSGTQIKAVVPAYRVDVMHPIDIVEDVAIAYGYENFVAHIPQISTIGEEDEFEKFQAKVADMLVCLGFLEANTYHLSQEDAQTTKMGVKMQLVEVRNPASAEFDVLRAWMIPSLIEVLRNNRQHEYPQRVFGFGSVFHQSPQEETGVEEASHAAVVMSADRVSFTEIKQVLENIMRNVDTPFEIEDKEHPSFIPGRVAQAVVGKAKVAFWGEVSPQVLENWQLEMPVVALEIDMEALFRVWKERQSR